MTKTIKTMTLIVTIIGLTFTGYYFLAQSNAQKTHNDLSAQLYAAKQDNTLSKYSLTKKQTGIFTYEYTMTITRTNKTIPVTAIITQSTLSPRPEKLDLQF